MTIFFHLKNVFTILFFLFVSRQLFPIFFGINCFSQVLSNNGAVVNITLGNVVNGGTVENNNGTITTGGNLWLTSNAINTGTFEGNGTYYVAGNWTNDGTFNAGTSTVIFNGGAAQTIGGLAIGNNFFNITIENTFGGVSLLTDQGITGTLTLTNGTFTTTGKIFTLLSNVAGTARIATITGGNITGNITMQRYVTGNDGWRDLAGPVASNLEDWEGEFSMSGFPGTDYPATAFKSVMIYDESATGNKDQGWIIPSNTSDVLTAGKGYLCWLGNDPPPGSSLPKTIDLVGPPNKFAIAFPVTYNDDPAQPATEDGWNLVGNPYPSTIDWNAAGWTKTNVNSTVYIWRDDLQVYASYTTAGPNPGPNGGVPTIASMQGFWIQTNAASPVLSLNETVKTAADQPFFKQPPPGEVILKLKITGQNGYSDETFMRIMPGAIPGFEADKDAYKLFSGSPLPPQISSLINDTLDLCLNSFSMADENKVIPLRVKTGTQGSVMVEVSGVAEIPSDYCVLLQDMYDSTIRDLRIDSMVDFFMPDTAYFPRFSLHLLKNDVVSCIEYASLLSGEKSEETTSGVFFVTVKDEQVTLYSDLTEPMTFSVNIYNLLGEKIIPEKICSAHKSSVTFDLSGKAEAIYFLAVSSGENSFTQKFFLR